MHELSIVMSIVEIAEEQVRKAGARQVEEIQLDIGTLAGVEPTALEFAWKEGVKRTVLEHAERKIHYLEGRARCMDCEHEFGVEQLYEPCPSCGQYLTSIVQGQELRVQTLVVS